MSAAHTDDALATPVAFVTGKRSRSNSSSSSSSLSSSHGSGSSIFSQLNVARSEDGSSSCSSPYSTKTSPSSSADYSDDERPSKSHRTSKTSVGPVQSQPSPAAQSAEEAALATLKNKCSLRQPPATVTNLVSSSSTPPELASASTGGKTLFVDCLVDATVHVLDMIWHAPVRKSIAFLQNVRSASSVSTGEISRPCQCPVGAPFTGGIPLDLFIRETLRRSRTSCSTLQAALLYCKRVGAEAIRKRAEREGVELDDGERKVLQGHARTYPSLSKSHQDPATEQLASGAVTADPILCSRRTFLAAVMISSKFLQDRTFSNRAWSKISGLSVKELGVVERRMLDAIEFNLYVGDCEWQSWTNYLKGDWKAGMDSCRCHSPTLSSVTQQISAPRKVLERTSSLHVDALHDAEAVPAAPTQAGNRGSTASPLSQTDCIAVATDSNLSTPTQSHHSEAGHQTPTKSALHKREQSLLPLAMTNNLASFMKNDTAKQHDGNSSIGPSTKDLSVPFPMRKGLAIRSMSTL